MTIQELAAKVRKIRLESGIKRQTILDAIGIGITQISLLESGNNATIGTYLELLNFYGWEIQLVEKPKEGIFAPSTLKTQFDCEDAD